MTVELIFDDRKWSFDFASVKRTRVVGLSKLITKVARDPNVPLARTVPFACAVLAAAGAANAKQDKGKAEKGASKEVKCAGINSCKGEGGCKGKTNSCKGQNTCKGQGWTKAKSEKECKAKGGTIVADEKK